MCLVGEIGVGDVLWPLREAYSSKSPLDPAELDDVEHRLRKYADHLGVDYDTIFD